MARNASIGWVALFLLNAAVYAGDPGSAGHVGDRLRAFSPDLSGWHQPFASLDSDESFDDVAGRPLDVDARNRYVLATTLTGIGVVTVWGVWKWDYFSRTPHFESEGGFGNDTTSGGADKCGHFYGAYLTSHILSYLYSEWGFSKDDAALYGAFSSWAIMSYMEFGDSFSSYGFSHEDQIANVLGCAFGYMLYKMPELAEKIDIRWEIGLEAEKEDLLTDYENSKYLVAIKLGGFDSMRDTILKHVELHVGYYTRGFSGNSPDRERNLFVGIGFNLTDLFRRAGHTRTATVLNYLQAPYTSATVDHDLNR